MWRETSLTAKTSIVSSGFPVPGSRLWIVSLRDVNPEASTGLRLDYEQRLTELHRLPILDQHLLDATGASRLERDRHAERVDDAEHLAGGHPVAGLQWAFCVGRIVEEADPLGQDEVGFDSAGVGRRFLLGSWGLGKPAGRRTLKEQPGSRHFELELIDVGALDDAQELAQFAVRQSGQRVPVASHRRPQLARVW